jgi:signal transduction histidine kinase
MRKFVSFKTNARHISQLGRELVTDFVTALVELVKNAYDADAEGVKIIFEDVKKPNGRIIIVDSGSGMTQQDIEEKWTVIGTNNKVRTSHSPKGRKYSGKKGIGRFAVERLAEKLSMYSFNGLEKPFKFTVNWNKYEEINVNAFRQRVNLLMHNLNDISSAKYLKSHIEYFLNNDQIDSNHKNFLQYDILNSLIIDFTTFQDIDVLIELENKFIPILSQYQEQELRVTDVNNEIIELDKEEQTNYVKIIYDFYHEIGVEQDNPTGLIMVLEGLRDEWKQKDIEKLQKELRVLVSPDFLEKDPFKILLQTTEFTIQNDILMNNIIDLNYAHIKASITSEEKVLNIKYLDKTNKAIAESYPVQDAFLCGDLELDLYYFVRDSENLSSDIFTVTHARRILDEFCGIKIYRDGFHVKPYGDPGNDWLLLDKRKVKETHGYLIGNNQVIGIIRISEEKNPLLIDATNREGIIENQPYEDLRRFVWECTDFISNIRYDEFKTKAEEDRLKEEEEKKKKEDELRIQEEYKREQATNEEIESSYNQVIDYLAKTPLPENVQTKLVETTDKIVSITKNEIEFFKDRLNEEREKQEKYYEKTKEIFEDVIKNKEFELNMYKNLATLGMLTGAFGHETKDIISRISNNIEFTKTSFPANIIDRDLDIIEAYDSINNDFNRVIGYSKLIVSYLKRDKREISSSINFKSIIEEIIKLYELMLKTQRINIIYDIDDFDAKIDILTIDIESIVINMITNSYEALKLRTENRQIWVSCKTYDEYYELRFEDNGKGVPLGFEEKIFQPFHTSKEDGIGLGLCIVKDAVNRYNGNISVKNSEIHNGAVFTIKFPRGENL